MGRLRGRCRTWLRPVAKRYPCLGRCLLELDWRVERYLATASRVLPTIIRPDPRQIHIAVTSHCNLSCSGCRYGRDFMPRSQLPWQVVRGALDDAKEFGVSGVRFYGGEPLLHPDLPKMVGHSAGLGLDTYVNTNGMLLEEKFDALYEAGLRCLTIGYYGTGAGYDAYVNRPGSYRRLEAGIAAIRKRYDNEIDIRINWLMMRPSCRREEFLAAWDFAVRYNCRMQIDLIQYSLPYFSEGPDRRLQFTPQDRAAIEEVVDEIIRRKVERPDIIRHELPGLRSIPEWLLKGPGMEVPCNAGQMLWIGPDGTVQLCYVTFKLGDLRHQRLRNMFFSDSHVKAGRDAFALDCPNCHCGYDTRVLKHKPSYERFRRPSAH